MGRSLPLLPSTGAPEAVVANFDDRDLVDLIAAIGLIRICPRLDVGFRQTP